MAITAGEILHVVINIPPRYMKSLLVSVLWPCWEWYQQPSGRYIFSSYAEGLASHHSLSRRRLIRSRAYQRLAPEVRLTRDQAQKLEFHNTKGGIMVATSMQGAPSRAIQELAGHRDVGTTQRCMHLSPAALEAAIRLLERSEPVARGASGEAAGTSA